MTHGHMKASTLLTFAQDAKMLRNSGLVRDSGRPAAARFYAFNLLGSQGKLCLMLGWLASYFRSGLAIKSTNCLFATNMVPNPKKFKSMNSGSEVCVQLERTRRTYGFPLCSKHVRRLEADFALGGMFGAAYVSRFGRICMQKLGDMTNPLIYWHMPKPNKWIRKPLPWRRWPTLHLKKKKKSSFGPLTP